MRLAVAGATIRHGEISIRITSSFGVATYPLHGNDVDSLVSAVDAALYEAKSSGRNQVKCASPR
jgi:diguanylate cyclase (GGDEF)-like protein